jgi:hypothetical protein
VPVLQIEHTVRDFDDWRRSFDSDPIGREEGGVRSFRLLRPIDDPFIVLIELDFDTVAEAETFLGKLRAMWVEAGPRLGFGTPQARIVEIVESASV